MSETDTPLSFYAPHISLFTAFTPPPPPSGTVAATALNTALTHLYHENRNFTACSCPDAHEHEHVLPPTLPLHQKLQILKQLLTVRPPDPLPPAILTAIETTLHYLGAKKQLTHSSEVPTLSPFKISLWRGDIATLKVTAIVNAANERLLGCFTPGHKCIDNVIHDAAGPRLRADCKAIMDIQDFLEGVGGVKVTRGYYLPAKYVLHTVGPMIPKRGGETRVEEFEKEQLGGCYRSCLQAMEELPDEAEGKTIAFCCVSTGVFGYPPEEAVHVAVDTVLEYLQQTPNTSITKVIFNVFTSTDHILYTAKLNTLLPSPLPIPLHSTLQPPLSPSLSLAKSWLSTSTTLLITAGAGLSASDGLDYTSQPLFRTHFPGMFRRGFTSLYSLFGFTSWPTPRHKWGYYFTHLIFAQSFPVPSPSVYTALKTLTSHFNDYFIRTSNADCLFERYFPLTHIATPQGSYALLQCMGKCRPDAVFPADTYISAARPFLDLEECVIVDVPGWEDVIPKCGYCGGEMFLCVRGGDYFNEGPFEEGNRRYEEFLERWREGDEGGEGGELVVLEIGAGFNTPGVIRWADERLVEMGRGRIKLVRVGLGGCEMVDWEVEGVDAVGIEGDAGVVVRALLEGLGERRVVRVEG